jgi:hypothetical protein
LIFIQTVFLTFSSSPSLSLSLYQQWNTEPNHQMTKNPNEEKHKASQKKKKKNKKQKNKLCESRFIRSSFASNRIYPNHHLFPPRPPDSTAKQPLSPIDQKNQKINPPKSPSQMSFGGGGGGGGGYQTVGKISMRRTRGREREELGCWYWRVGGSEREAKGMETNN